MSFPPSITFACAIQPLPASFRTGHRLEDLRWAVAFGFTNPLWSKAEAAYHAFRANLESGTAYGHGNRALRRMCDICAAALRLDGSVDSGRELAEWYDRMDREGRYTGD